MKLSQMNYRNAPGPGDLWGSPEDDGPDTNGQCECCDRHFDFDPKDFCDADEDGPTYDPPTMCDACRENDCDPDYDKGPCPVAAECEYCGEWCPETGCVECFRWSASEWFENSTSTCYGVPS